MNEISLLGTIPNPPTYHCTEAAEDLLRLVIRTNPRPGAGRPATGGVAGERSSRMDTMASPRRSRPTDHHCIAWGPAALDLHAHLNAGDQVLIRGELTYRRHSSRAGLTSRIPEIKITGYTYLGKPAAVLSSTKQSVSPTPY